ncbi:MAG TPA: Gfo/Idh/MocA family oxidoreductase [Candidatus Limnocylindrales bacterium]|nr:Gfo/Idh/MocA family oxidoreductase [Candidatus Limnocylindrales bacterium]
MTRSGPVGIGIIGAGVISDTYLVNLASFPDTTVVAIGDLRPEAARAKAAEHAVSVAGDVDAVLGHPDVEIVVNLTIPAAHAEVAGRALAAGKHVWNEKPLALDRASARAVLDAAEAAGLRVGCAPDTFLGAGLQATRNLIEQGAIGEPLTALAIVQSPGPDRWHPNPAFLFQAGGGPLLDLGPYHLTALVQLVGPIASVAAVASTARRERTIGSGPRAGETFEVTVPTHVAAVVRFTTGASAQVVLSFDSAVPRILLEVAGRDGTLIATDPNGFDGEVGIRRSGFAETEIVARTTATSERGTGVLDMARAIREGRPHRAAGELAYHVLDAMLAIEESAARGAFVDVASRPPIVPPLPADWDPHALTVGGGR